MNIVCRAIKCKGRIHIDVNFSNILHEAATHNDPTSAAQGDIRLFQDEIRSHAMNNKENTQNVTDNCLSNVSDQMVAHLPHFKYTKRNIQRQKHDLPQLPLDKNFNIIPIPLTITLRNDNLVRFDSGPGNNHLLIFVSINQLKILESTEEILIDGTFKVCI